MEWRSFTHKCNGDDFPEDMRVLCNRTSHLDTDTFQAFLKDTNKTIRLTASNYNNATRKRLKNTCISYVYMYIIHIRYKKKDKAMQTETLVRKQFYISTENVTKLEQLTKQLKSSSSAKIVRDAIDAYNPNENQIKFEQKALFELARSKVKEAIEATEKTNKKIDFCLETLSKKEGF